MRSDELVTISLAEYEELKKQVAEGRKRGHLFDAEEMKAIRDQYQELIELERARRDELEWKLRVELARVRDAELSARRNADDMRQLESSLLSFFEEGGDTQVRPAAPGPAVPAPSPIVQGPPVTVRPSAVPPPIPTSPAPGSHADKFRQAMAHRKRYSA
jgi:hypothetical protein